MTLPEWIPILPPPGVYTDPFDGSVFGISQEAMNHLRSWLNFPVTYEHRSPLGRIGSTRVRLDGITEGHVNWIAAASSVLPRGVPLYVSPSWYEDWSVTGPPRWSMAECSISHRQPHFAFTALLFTFNKWRLVEED